MRKVFVIFETAYYLEETLKRLQEKGGKIIDIIPPYVGSEFCVCYKSKKEIEGVKDPDRF